MNIRKYPIWSRLILFGGFYYLLMVVGYEFYYSPENVAMFWPASGAFLAALLQSEKKEWGWYLLAVLICQVWVDMIYYDRVWYLGIMFGLANSLEAFAGAIFIKKFFKESIDAFTFRFLFAIIGVGALFSPVFSATVGALIVVFGYGADPASYWSIWEVWWAADFLGILIVVPTILAWQSINPADYRAVTTRRKALELAALVLSLLVVQQHLFGSEFNQIDNFYDQPYILLPFLLWAALRFSPRTITTIIFFLVFLIVWHTDQGRGVLVYLSRTPNEVILSLQSFLAIIAISMLYLIVLVNALRKSQNNLETLNRELEQRVAMRTKQLSDANRELDSFAYSVSHDLQAPVRAIVGFSEIMKDNLSDTMDEEEEEYLGRISNAAYKMQDIIQSLLSLSRINRKQLILKPVNITALVQKVFADIAALQPGVQPDDLECRTEECGVVQADPQILEVSLHNLLANAVKFAHPGRPLKIVFGCMENEGEEVFFIRDNGIGMDMAYSQTVFQPFQRLHDDSEYSGTGIGLSIVQRVIHRHGGKIWIESELGKGTTFYFTLAPQYSQPLL